VSETDLGCPVRPAVPYNFRNRSNTNGKTRIHVAVFLQLIHVVGNVLVMALWRLQHRQRSITGYYWMYLSANARV